MSDKVIYTVGGTVQAGGGIYISRDADEELLRLCRAGEFCYVLTARQMGKSSLMVATRERLAAEGIRSVEIDLTKMGTELSGLTAEQWYLGLIDLIVDQLNLEVDYVAWWDERAHLGPTQRLSQFLQQIMLEQVSEPVVIFIDEIDSTLRFDFTDDFFAAIRACYNARASDPAFKRLSFVLLGVATPGDLISDPQRTPFNIGRGMDLTDFTEQQAIPLADGLDLPPNETNQVLTWILDWTGGHPYLTQRLCAAAAASPAKDWDAAAVDKVVEETFFGEQSAQDSNLRFVRDMLTQRAPDKAAVLKTYRRIHAGKAVPDEERSLVKTYLKLSGIVKTKDGYLDIRNRIYRRVFDLAWVKANTPSNWAPIVIGIALFIALLAVGFTIHNAWVANQVDASTLKFYRATIPEERVAHLANIFDPPCLFQVTDYDYQARELFYGLSREEQLALFSVRKKENSDSIVVIKGLYITLADTDSTDSTRPLLEAMVKALGNLDATEEVKKLEDEMNSWLEGRKLAKQNQYTDALVEYDKAIALNGENPATLYERARVHAKLSQYEQAVQDLERVMTIAARVPAPPPPTTPTSTSAVTPTSIPSTSSQDRTPTRHPSASVTVSPKSLPTSTETPTPIAMPLPSSFVSQFANTGQIRSAVKELIDDFPQLANLLAEAPMSAYPNLREFGLVSILTPTSTPSRVIEAFTIRDAQTVITIEPYEAITIVTDEVVLITAIVSSYVEEENLTFDWSAAIGRISKEIKGPTISYVAPTDPGSDLVAVDIMRGDKLVERAAIIISITATPVPPTLTPTATPPCQLTLRNPLDGVAFGPETSEVILEWQCNRPLAPEEYFFVDVTFLHDSQIWHDGTWKDPTHPEIPLEWRKKNWPVPHYLCEPGLSNTGWYDWSVTVKRKTGIEPSIDDESVCTSSTWSFKWVGCEDSDGDGYYYPLDCNNNDPSVYPCAREWPGDGKDNNCDGMDTCQEDRDMDGYCADCDSDDNDPSVH